MKKTALICLLSLPVLSGTVLAADTPYANAIKALTPTFYYELNETDPDGDVMDSMGNASETGFFNGVYGEEGEEGFAARLKVTDRTQLNAAIDGERFEGGVCDVRDLDLV